MALGKHLRISALVFAWTVASCEGDLRASGSATDAAAFDAALVGGDLGLPGDATRDAARDAVTDGAPDGAPDGALDGGDPCVPLPEVCNGVDDDCDGALDEGDDGPLREPCYGGPAGTAEVGLCRSGVRTCGGGTFGPCAGEVRPAEEMCNTEDDDCNGIADDVGGEGCACEPGAVRECGVPPALHGVGVCRRGTQRCMDDGSRWGACEGEVRPGVEACDGLDNDCNGQVDDAVGVGEACRAGVGACAAEGRRGCDPATGALVCDARPGAPGPEACDDGVDNDCDGRVDEGCPAAPPPERGCQADVRPADGPLAEPVLRRSFGTGGGYRGSPQVITLDGAPVIVSSGFDAVRAHALDGAVRWSAAIQGRNYGGTILADLDGDGAPELVAGDNRGRVYAWRRDGQALAGWPFRVHGDASIRSLLADDLDGDGRDEVVVFSSLTDSPPQAPNPNMYVIGLDGRVRAGWPHYREGDPHTGRACNWCGGYNLNVAVGDLEPDGTPELVFTQDRYSISIFHPDGTPQMTDGATFSWCGEGPLHWGEVRSYVPEAAERTTVCTPHDGILEFTYSPPLLADVDGDGALEVLAVANLEQPVGTTLGSALAVYRANRVWQPGFVPYPRSEGYLGEGWPIEIQPTVVAANITGDAALELLVTHLDGFLTAYARDGRRLWRVRYADRPCVPTEPVVADLDADGAPEVLVFSTCQAEGRSRMLVVNGNGRVRLDREMPFATFAAPTLVDLDGDGDLEMLVHASNWQPNLYVYDWPGADTRCLIWPTGRGDARHRGRLR